MAPRPLGPQIQIRPVTSESDVPMLAHLADIALKPDGFHEFRRRYSSKNIYDDCAEKVTASLRDVRGRYFLFKAVRAPESASESQSDVDAKDSVGKEETIVAFAQWQIGYIETPKTDPFAPKKEMVESSTLEAGVSNVATSEAGDQDEGEAVGIADQEASKPVYPNPDAELLRKLSNSYIGTIRGKRHLFLHRLMVHPSYQRQGIGQRLLDWGIETADRENIVSWLFSRPAGSRLYERNGWKEVLATEVEVPDEDLKVAPVISMLRLPKGRTG
ncbi:uncharacterized protein Z518_03838 [Rhinocladiella mackenziei CBS 650.93]|uniref:N-acetyltransferase domain-containing protein n=1 Tax=Rhinocladiella mackenziei CBS 650.93 TaxID=1442369 RepID=A0A0D2J9R6_9EURO|nr:uncharacterized protein Z518_03838 [Rhinocladiella mackenziei CBS 650.93]KIX05865.1 hypothetical protein Z518_03838 [Rhinocladiella mackenziei CBS 650.93]